MNDSEIRRILVNKGLELFEAPRTFHDFTGEPEADRLLNDIDRRPHAFVLACVMDRQMKTELAWLIPYRYMVKLGDFEFSTLKGLTLEQIEELMTKPEPLHRFPNRMSENFYQAVRLVETRYDGDASRIWEGEPSSATVVYRFLEFKGIGPKIATMAANILARDFKVPFSDYYSIDVSPDVHVRRVFVRLGLTDPHPTVEQIIYRARALHPQFPGLLDLPAWEIGRNWCKARRLECLECYMSEVCPTFAQKRKGS